MLLFVIAGLIISPSLQFWILFFVGGGVLFGIGTTVSYNISKDLRAKKPNLELEIEKIKKNN